MSLHPYSDEYDSDANGHASLILLDEDALIQQLLAQGYPLNEQQRDHVRRLLQCKTARLQDIVIALRLAQQTDDTDDRLGWNRVFLA